MVTRNNHMLRELFPILNFFSHSLWSCLSPLKNKTLHKGQWPPNRTGYYTLMLKSHFLHTLRQNDSSDFSRSFSVWYYVAMASPCTAIHSKLRHIHRKLQNPWNILTHLTRETQLLEIVHHSSGMFLSVYFL